MKADSQRCSYKQESNKPLLAAKGQQQLFLTCLGKEYGPLPPPFHPITPSPPADCRRGKQPRSLF